MCLYLSGWGCRDAEAAGAHVSDEEDRKCPCSPKDKPHIHYQQQDLQCQWVPATGETVRNLSGLFRTRGLKEAAEDDKGVRVRTHAGPNKQWKESAKLTKQNETHKQNPTHCLVFNSHSTLNL